MAEDDRLKERELLLGLYLIEYHRHAFSVRSQGILPRDSTFDPPEVRELVNLVKWQGGGMSIPDKSAHIVGLNGIVNRNAEELKMLMSRVRDGNMSTHLLEKIDQLNIEMTAAHGLMEYLVNAR